VHCGKPVLVRCGKPVLVHYGKPVLVRCDKPELGRKLELVRCGKPELGHKQVLVHCDKQAPASTHFEVCILVQGHLSKQVHSVRRHMVRGQECSHHLPHRLG